MKLTIQTDKEQALATIEHYETSEEGILYLLEKEIERIFEESNKKKKNFIIPEHNITAEIVKIDDPNYRYKILFRKDGQLLKKSPNIVKTEKYKEFIEKIIEKNKKRKEEDDY